jgi:glutamate decarboxylase
MSVPQFRPKFNSYCTSLLTRLQVDADELIEKINNSPGGQHHGRAHIGESFLTPYSSKYSISAPSKHQLPKEGAPAEAVAQMIRDELDLDGRPNLNLASFVGTYMEKEVRQWHPSLGIF